MADQHFGGSDPLDFMRNMWGQMGFSSLPGMVAPTIDVEELEKRIADLKAVEGWLRMNLSMLQMTIQGLEMQKTTLTAVKAMGDMASAATQGDDASGGEGVAGVFSQAAMWPWQMMQQMQAHLQESQQAVSDAAGNGDSAPAKKAAARSRKPKA